PSYASVSSPKRSTSASTGSMRTGMREPASVRKSATGRHSEQRPREAVAGRRLITDLALESRPRRRAVDVQVYVAVHRETADREVLPGRGRLAACDLRAREVRAERERHVAQLDCGLLQLLRRIHLRLCRLLHPAQVLAAPLFVILPAED